MEGKIDPHPEAAAGFAAAGENHAPRVLIVTAVAAEREAVLRGLGGSSRFEVLAAGAGTAAAAAGTAAALAAGPYGCVISAGIGGGFPGLAPVGSLAVASEMIAADLGAETPEGFRSAAELGFGSVSVPADSGTAEALAAALAAAGLVVSTGPVLTVSTATGTAGTAAALAARHPGAVAEAMEGHGVAVAAHRFGIAALELRAISNPVGPRDRAAWKIPEALDALAAAAAILLEVL
ncbi:futalosine hydrolase [Paenibacillus tianjinensis]|uniref:Futalosine hydrolase n=1 Tax=Paenibacillus tianjinensis TaxID=2810347 RepID=A0ABX7LA73_9BACL|nr:futalosine hydrolase [Paenibacillus tianjinensis]QSF44887.1 futalosine hydrolase [Paenibacillus tianjinensis]